MNEQSPSPAGERFRVLCPHCGVRFSASANLIGRRVTCLKCTQPFTVPPRKKSTPAKTTAKDRTGRRASRSIGFVLVGFAGLVVGVGLGFGAAWWLLQLKTINTQQLLTRLQELESDHQGLRQRYEGTQRDLESSNLRLAQQLKDAESRADRERSQGEELLQRMQSTNQNRDLNSLLDQDVAQAAESVLGLLTELSTSPKSDYAKLRWEVRENTTTAAFRIHESTWRVAWRLRSATDQITIDVFRSPLGGERASRVESISGQGSGARQIKASPGVFYLRITTNAPAEVVIEAANS